MCFIGKEAQNFILKFGQIFLWRETVLRAHGMKSDEKHFFCCQIYAIVWGKMVHVVIDRYFSLFLKSLKIFPSPRLSLMVPLLKPSCELRTIYFRIQKKKTLNKPGQVFISIIFLNFSFFNFAGFNKNHSQIQRSTLW